MKTDCEKVDILIRARDEAIKDAVSTTLQENGLKILAVHDEHEMFKLLDEYQPHILILESGLPKIFGLEVHEIIRRSERFRDIKIILLYSNASELDAAMNFISGPDEYIETDHIHDLLISKIRGIIPDDSGMSTDMSDAGAVLALSEAKTDIKVCPEYIHKEARKLAMIIISDIALYNKDKIEKGLKEGSFFELLKDEIEKGKTFYNNRISPDVLATTNYFDEALEELIERVCAQNNL